MSHIGKKVYYMQFFWYKICHREDIFSICDAGGWIAKKSNSTPLIWSDQQWQPNAVYVMFCTRLFVEENFMPHALKEKYYRPPMVFS